MTITLAPTSELVALAWLRSLPGITDGMVGAILPTDMATWETSGFYTVSIVGGVPTIDTPVRRPLVQVDAWAVKVGSQRPPWGRCDQLAARVVAGCYSTRSGPSSLTLKASASSTAPAVMFSAWAGSEPTRLYADDASVAHIRLDVRLDWRGY